MTKKLTGGILRFVLPAFLLLLFLAALQEVRADDPHAVTFDDNGGMHDVGPEAGEVKVYSAANYPGVTITAKSAAGDEFADDDGDGVLLLPDGAYEFHIACQHNHVVGDVTVAGADAGVSVGMWDFDDWLDVDGLRASTRDGPGESGTRPTFAQGEIPVEKGDHFFRVDMPDIWINLNIYVNYNPAVFSAEEAAVKIPTALNSYIRKDNGEQGGYDARVMDPNDRTWWSKQIQFDSLYSGIGYMFLEIDSAEGNTGTIRVFLKGDIPTYFRYQEYTVQADRIPTLSGLRAAAAGGSALTPTESFSAVEWAMIYDYEYRTPNNVKQVEITPTPLLENYTVTVNGQSLTDGKATVDMELDDETGETLPTVATVTVSACGYSKDYNLTFTPMELKKVTFNTPSGTTVQVFNKDGEEMLPASAPRPGGNDTISYLFRLPGGETYTWLATRGEYYHSTQDFTMEESHNTIIYVSVIDDEDWLDDLTFHPTYWGDGRLHSMVVNADEIVFSPETHYYDLVLYDSVGSFRYTPVYEDTEYVMTALSWNVEQNCPTVATGFRSGKAYTSNNRMLMTGPTSGELRLRFSWVDEDDDVTYYQDYILNVKRFSTLSELACSCGNTALALDHSYEAGDLAFTVKAPFDATTMTVYAPQCLSMVNNLYQFYYTIRVNGVETDENDLAEVPLNGTTETETITIEVGCPGYEEAARTIVLTVLKTQPVSTEIRYEPAQAVLTIRNNETAVRVWPDAKGRWMLNDGYSYTYTLTAPGYVGRRNTIAVITDDTGTFLVLDGDEANPIPATLEPTEAGERFAAALRLSIPEAPENTTLDHTMEAEWADFRGTSYTRDDVSGQIVIGGSANTNNGVTGAPLPIDAGESALYWAVKIGEGWGAKAVSSPILVDGDIVVYAADQIFRVDPLTGAVKARGQMVTTSAFSINPPFYYDGMIFVALSHGNVQAFDAATLESLWIYTDPEGDQPNSNITIYDGYLYTGFWNKEDVDSSFVCMTVTDEDPTRGDEPKIATWTHLQPGGFYWAGAYVCDDFLLVGTDDGKSGYMTLKEFNWSSELLMLDRHTGAVLDKRSELKSDIRCAISYDPVTDAYYFTSKGGNFYQARVARDESGAWKISELNELKLDNFNNIGTAPPMSTSTPVIYNGRAYIGVSGVGQFNQYNGHNITVIDLESWTIAYKVPTQGYPQTSGLLTTAYEEATGYAYVYFFDNMIPGELRMLRDRPGQTVPDPITTEYYTQNSTTKTYETPYVLFTPVGDQAQYAICSPICDEYGVIYFKNDSGYLMAFGPSIEKLEVTTQPARTAYEPGETFDPTGMVVTMTYANGMTRDVTEHVLWSAEPLEEGETEITFRYPTLYHNEDNADGTSAAGVRGDTAFASVGITVGAQRGTEYRIEEIRVLNGDAQSVDVIPEGSFTAEIRVTNLSAASADALVLAAYDANGRMLGLYTLDVVAEQGQTVRLEKPLDNSTGGIAKLKAFMLPKGGSPTPLAEAATFGG